MQKLLGATEDKSLLEKLLKSVIQALESIQMKYRIHFYKGAFIKA